MKLVALLLALVAAVLGAPATMHVTEPEKFPRATIENCDRLARGFRDGWVQVPHYPHSGTDAAKISHVGTFPFLSKSQCALLKTAPTNYGR